MVVRLAFAGFLMAHALIHGAFLVPTPAATAGGPAWPFSTSESWLFTRFGVSSDIARLVALALVATTLAGFALAALSVLGLAPASAWLPGSRSGRCHQWGC